jgi:hypothetical protein
MMGKKLAMRQRKEVVQSLETPNLDRSTPSGIVTAEDEGLVDRLQQRFDDWVTSSMRLAYIEGDDLRAAISLSRALAAIDRECERADNYHDAKGLAANIRILTRAALQQGQG